MKFRRRFDSKVQVDLVPMIDVVFQLILFFLVSTTFALLPAITLNLPESDTSESERTDGIVIAAAADGSLWFNSRPVTFQELEASLSAYVSEPPR